MVQMTLQQQLESGLAHHRAGRLADAEKIYRQVLAAHPNNADALFLLGSLAHQSGKFEAACDLLNQAILANPNAPDYYVNLGIVLMAQGRIPDAAANFPKALQLRPQHSEAHFGMGVALSQMHQLQPALAAFRQTVALSPNHAIAWMLLGNTLRELNQMEEAVSAYRRAIALNPKLPDVHNNLGGALGNLNRLDEAEAAFRTALALQPNDVSACNNLGLALQKLNRLDEALALFQQAVKSKPDHAEYLNNLGMTLGDSGHLEDALSAFRRAITLKPDNVEYVYHMGVALEDLARPEDALLAYHKALTLNPNHAETHMSIGMVHLLMGNFAAGWKEYEWRAKCPHVPMQRNFSQPQWTGSDLTGKTILLHWEQGLGDTIHFIRYAPLVAARGARVILKCQPELETLMKRINGISTIAVHENLLPPFDLHCPLQSLPLAFGTTLDAIPTTIPYITPPPDRVEAWANRLGPSAGEHRVGLAWAGQPKHRNDRRRSMRLNQFAPLAEIKPARFFSLQKGPAAAQTTTAPPSLHLVDYTADLHDLADTAALIANLDLVICVDTSVAHLAGAMGKPVWLLLPFVPDWRWLLNRTNSPWYPTMRIFRQPTECDWDSVIADVGSAIAQRCK
jgi:tetratricopeptide (TPR) repeat protein